jgi:hypothetical protein
MSPTPPAPPAEAPARPSDLGLLLGTLNFDLVRLGALLRALVAEHERNTRSPHEAETRLLAIIYCNNAAMEALGQVEQTFSRIRPLAGPVEAIVRHWESSRENTEDTTTAPDRNRRPGHKPN